MRVSNSEGPDSYWIKRGRDTCAIKHTRRGVEIGVGLLTIELPCTDFRGPRVKSVFRNVGAKSGDLVRMGS